jgi:hypothetical protein
MNVSPSREVVLLNPADLSAVRAFEKGFYAAFNTITHQSLIRQIWDWDDEDGRISLKCPLPSATIFAWQQEGTPCFYVAGSFDREGFSQLDFYGFKKPEDVGHYCEIFTLFSTPLLRAPIFEVEQLFLEPVCYEYARSRGATHLLATCTKRLIKLYTRWRWEIIEMKVIAGEERYFIKLPLSSR